MKTIIDERFEDYKLPSMFIGTCKCDWKCPLECGLPIEICQNNPMAQQPNVEVSNEEIFKMYISNPLTSAIVIGGLEPMLQFEEVISLIEYFRNMGCDDVFVIYTGYRKNELHWEINELQKFKNIIVKFGRYKPNQNPHFDNILGVNLANNEQMAEKIS